MALKVALLHRLELSQSAFSRCSTVSEQIISRMAANTVSLEEHVLGAAEADALSAELHGLLGVVRVIGVRADASDGDTCRPKP